MPVPLEVQNAVQDEARELQSRYGVPGLAVGVADRQGPAWSVAMGTTCHRGGDPITTSTLFSLQSISKVYTATAVLCAVDDGVLDLDEPITTYLPTFTVRSRFEPSPEHRITLRHLLSHRAGLVHEAPRGSNYDSSDTSFDDHCASIAETTLTSPVGSRYNYSNLGIDLAALALQRATTQPFPLYVQERLLEPLGLRRTTFDPTQIQHDPDRAVGHTRAGTPPLRVPMIGAGGAYASVEDVLRFLTFHLAGGEGLVSGAILQQMYQVPDSKEHDQVGYGLGLDTGLRNGRLVRNHGGGGFGFLCDLVWDSEARLGAVVLTNSEDHPFQTELSTRLLDLLLPPRPDSR